MKREEALRIYEKEVDHFNQTRSIQWKFIVSTWTLLLVSTYFIKSKGIEIPYQKLCFWSIIFLAIYTYFIYLNQLSLNSSKKIWNSILDQLNKSNRDNTIDVNVPKITKTYWIGWRGFSWTVYFVLSTGVLIAILIFIITSQSKCNC